MIRETSAGGLVRCKAKVLLVKVRNLEGEKVWTFPKGHLEKGETSIQAALREVEEETGWRCRCLGPLLDVNYKFKRQGRLVDKRVKWYSMNPVEKTGKADAEEILSVRWVPMKEASRWLRYPGDLKLIKKATEGDGRI